jgi:mono/diheme cytochrome c family protein
MMKNKIVISCIVLLFLVSACNSGSKSPGQQSEPPIVTGQPVSPGQLLYNEKCAACHGQDGTAGVANAANLRSSKLENKAIIQVITNGKNGMPPFGGQFTPDDIEKLTNYVMSLRQ